MGVSMARPILILDNAKDMVSYHFKQFVKPRLDSEIELEIVKDAQSAESRLSGKSYALVIAESIIAPKPLVIGEAKLEGKSGFWSKLFPSKSLATATVSIEGLTGRSISDLLMPVGQVLPRFAAARPDLKIIVVCHGRGGQSKEEKAQLAAMPNVAGVFGWLSTEATAKKVARLISDAVAHP